MFEDNVKRGSWKTAIVEELIKGKDNVVRGAKIRVITKGKPIRMSRPIQKLYPLEIRCETERTENAGVGNAKEQLEQTVKETLKRNVPRRGGEQWRLHLNRKHEKWLTYNQVKGGSRGESVLN